ncbi:hypothetical protein [Gymnodinialimonas sp. 57CJ19]
MIASVKYAAHLAQNSLAKGATYSFAALRRIACITRLEGAALTLS